LNRSLGSAGDLAGEVSTFEHVRIKQELRAYRQQLKSLAARLSLGEERSRRRIATQLHDTIGQILAAAKLRLSILRQEIAVPGALKDLDEVIELCDRAIGYTRSLSFELSPLQLYELGFSAALRSLVDKYREVSPVELELSDDGRPKPLDDEAGVLLFLALRELLDRVVARARVRRVRISVRAGRGEILVAVESDGGGFGAGMIDGSQPGLLALRERLKFIGGALETEQAAGRGARVVLSVPFQGRGSNQLELGF
jgi:signal transduction histidine kinase